MFFRGKNAPSATTADPNDNETTASNNHTVHSETHKLTGRLFLASVAGLSILGGFGMTIAKSKKKDPTFFSKGLIASRALPESGVSLATRALGWGTLYSVTGVGFLCLTVWTLLSVTNMKEFTAKMQSFMPRIPSKEKPGRNEFESIRDLFEYLAEEDKKEKKKDSS